MQSLKAAAIVLAAASLCAAQAPPPRELRVEFEGNRVFTSEQLRKAATQCYAAGGGEAFDAAALDYCLRRDVADVMRRAGYVRAQFGAARTATDGEVVTVTVPVEENEFYRFGRVTIEGAAHFDAKSLRELLPLKRGDIADAVAVTRWASTSLQRKYADEGFIRFAADVEPEYRAEPGAPGGVLDLTVKIDEGKRFTLRSVKFEGDAGAPVDVLREALGLREGEVFKQREYVDALGELNRHILFDREHGRYEGGYQEQDVELTIDEEAGALDIKIHLNGKGQWREARTNGLARRP